jgi:hypothetical protein
MSPATARAFFTSPPPIIINAIGEQEQAKQRSCDPRT